MPSSEPAAKSDLKISKLITAKGKLRMSSIWSEERLENVLFEIENIPYKLKDAVASSNKKKRVSTETSEYQRMAKPDHISQFSLNVATNSHNSSSKNPMAGLIGSTSNPKFSGKRM